MQHSDSTSLIRWGFRGNCLNIFCCLSNVKDACHKTNTKTASDNSWGSFELDCCHLCASGSNLQRSTTYRSWYIGVGKCPRGVERRGENSPINESASPDQEESVRWSDRQVGGSAPGGIALHHTFRWRRGAKDPGISRDWRNFAAHHTRHRPRQPVRSPATRDIFIWGCCCWAVLQLHRAVLRKSILYVKWFGNSLNFVIGASPHPMMWLYSG